MPREQRTDWNEQSLGDFRRLHAEGHKPDHIAKHLKFRLGAVKGKLHRLGLLAPKRVKLAVPVREERKTQRKSPFVFNGGPSIAPKFFPEPDIGITPLLVTTVALGPRQCKWVVGDAHKHCGHVQQDGSVYCPGHHQVAYTGEVIDGAALARAYGWLK